MGGLVGIGFSIKINPIHTKIHVFITAFRACRLASDFDVMKKNLSVNWFIF